MIHIACNIDSNFTIHCAVTLTSLFANNRNSEFCVHIIASTLPEVWGIERSGFFNGREKWVKGFESQMI